MGTYVVTGGTKGIGEKAIEILRSHGHEAISIATKKADINADLGTIDGRETIIRELHERFPRGIDGLICNHGIPGIPRFKSSYVLSVNYFGAITVIEGLYDLLKMKNGGCVVTVSGSIATAKPGKYFVDELLNNCGDEERIGRLVDTFPLGEDGIIMYLSSKLALAKWVRRVSISWAAHGININAVAPGAVDTAMMQDTSAPADYYYPMPMLFPQNKDMDPFVVAQTLVYLVMPEAKGISGEVIFCDAGASAVFDTDKYF